MRKNDRFDRISQFAIPLLTVGGFLLTGLKYPGGLVVGLLAQPF